MAWMLVVLVVVLASVLLITREFLSSQMAGHATQELEHEGNKFISFARTQPAMTPAQLFDAHLRQQYPDGPEVLLGVIDGPNRLHSTVQAQPGRPGLEQDKPLLRRIVDDPRPTGEVPTAVGPMRWTKIRTVPPPGRPSPPAWFITGYYTGEDSVTVNRTVQTLMLVSGFGVLLAAVASWVVAGQILQPVRAVRRAAAEISEHDLTRRIPVEGRDDVSALAEQFNAMLQRLELAFRTQRQFVDDASHELRTPITIVRGHLELLGDDPAEREEVVRLCTDELDRMTRIVEDLLVLAKVDRPDFVSPRVTSLVELTSDIDAKVNALGDRVWVLEHIGEADVVVDEQRVTQAMLQLAQNAVQHTDPGSRVLVGSRVREGRLLLWVTDHGPGIEPATLETIFDRFAHGSSERRGGAGLGLAIVKAIAHAHHGTVHVASEPGRGATFWLDLPTGTSGSETGGSHPGGAGTGPASTVHGVSTGGVSTDGVSTGGVGELSERNP